VNYNQLASVIVAILTPLSPYLAKAGEAVAEEVGKAIFTQASLLYTTLRKEFEQDNDQSAKQALQQLDQTPAKAQPILQKHIVKQAESNPDFAIDISSQVENLKILMFECLRNKFRTQDLQELYFRLGIGWDDLAGGVVGRQQKAIALIEYVEFRDRMAELISAMWKVYPGLKC
jgi:hypothetical protein